MLYDYIKVLARAGYPLYIKHQRIIRPECTKLKGPLLLACNHPNSFLDAIILCTLFDQPIYSLARGDAFKKPWAKYILNQLHIYPVYRTREGVENLNENYVTFEICRQIFKNGGIVLIFSEALCENEWHLRPLKKGTARLALSSWEEGIDLKVLPVGLNYSSFKRFGKTMLMGFGNIIDKSVMEGCTSDGQILVKFNKQLQSELEQLVLEIDKNDHATIAQQFEKPLPNVAKFLLAIPALAGYIIHWPLYFFWNQIAGKKALDTGHYDSVIIGGLFLLYPLYLLLWAIALVIITGYFWAALVPCIFPFLAWSLLQWRRSTSANL